MPPSRLRFHSWSAALCLFDVDVTRAGREHAIVVAAHTGRATKTATIAGTATAATSRGMIEGNMDSIRILAIVLGVSALLFAWMFRFETFGTSHRNRFTGATCPINEECWIGSRQGAKQR
jgi:hypothetical protein